MIRIAKVKIEHVVDTVTGQVLHTKQRNMKMYLFTEKGFMFQSNTRSVKTYPTIDLPKLSHSQLGQLLLLARVMEDGNKITLTIGEIAIVLRQTVSRSYAFIRNMIKCGVMKRKNGTLYINPLYMFTGKHMSRDLYLLFQESLDKVLPAWTKKEFKE